MKEFYHWLVFDHNESGRLCALKVSDEMYKFSIGKNDLDKNNF